LEEFADKTPKGVIRRRKLKKDGHYNGQKKKTIYDLQNTTQKTKDPAIPIVMSVLFQFTSSDYSFWCFQIIKPFLENLYIFCEHFALVTINL
jgi:hypothetical protein